MTQAIFAKQQYEFVKGSRNVLFDYCKNIPQTDFVNQNTSFGRGGSMRNLLVHSANTYRYWIAEVCMQKKIDYPAYEDFPDIDSVIAFWDSVDDFIAEFLLQMDDLGEIEYEINGTKNSASAFQIFSHVITHEYHHKGQILSISRHLGHIPVDTDIMR